MRYNRTVCPDGFSVWRANAEDRSHKDVLETRNHEKRGVLVVHCLQMIIFGFWIRDDLGRRVPVSTANPEERPELYCTGDYYLTNDARQYLL